jgi:uncharacterized protein YraI
MNANTTYPATRRPALRGSWRACLRAALCVGLCAILAAGCGASATPLAFTLSSPQPDAVIEVGADLLIQGEVTGDNIVRVDVLIDGATVTALSTGDPSRGVNRFPVQVTWRPMLVGTHIVQLTAFGQGEFPIGGSEPVLFNVRATQSLASPTPRPTATATATMTPESASASTSTSTTTTTTTTASTTESTMPTATAAVAAPQAELTVIGELANVRDGPGLNYTVLGQLLKGATAPVRGKSADGAWWQIAYATGPAGLAWVFGELVQPNEAARAATVAPAPPTPTLAPTPVGGATPPPPTAPAAAGGGPPCDASSPYWRGTNPNYPFCVVQDFLWGDPNGDWATYNNGQNVPLSASWNLFGSNIDAVFLRFDHVDGACPFTRPAGGWLNRPVQPADSYRFNVSDFPGGATLRVYLLVALKDGRSVTFGEKRLCIN